MPQRKKAVMRLSLGNERREAVMRKASRTEPDRRELRSLAEALEGRVDALERGVPDFHPCKSAGYVESWRLV